MVKKYTPQEIELMYTHYPITTKKEMMHILPHRTWPGIVGKAHRLKIYKGVREERQSKPFTQMHRDNMRKARIKFNKEHPWKGTKYTYNHNYFSKLTPNSAYVLGFIAADGCITGKKNKQGKYYNHLVIDQAETEPLLAIQSELKTNAPISKQIQKKSFKPGSILYSLAIHNQSIVNDLKKLGITPRKTFTLQYPHIDQMLDPHFIRGYMDGDGCIVVSKKHRNTSNEREYICLSFCSASRNFILKLKDRLDGIANVKGGTITTGNLITLRYNGSYAQSILNWLYKDAELSLSRKRIKWVNYINYRYSLKKGYTKSMKVV